MQKYPIKENRFDKLWQTDSLLNLWKRQKLNKMYTDTLCKWKKDMGIQAGAFEI